MLWSFHLHDTARFITVLITTPGYFTVILFWLIYFCALLWPSEGSLESARKCTTGRLHHYFQMCSHHHPSPSVATFPHLKVPAHIEPQPRFSTFCTRPERIAIALSIPPETYINRLFVFREKKSEEFLALFSINHLINHILWTIPSKLFPFPFP